MYTSYARLPTARARSMLAALLAWPVGVACQLQQASLWPLGIYVALGLLALVLYALGTSKTIANRAVSWWLLVWLVVLAAGTLAFASTGARAVVQMDTALNPALEGRDITVTGVVAQMPQRNDSSLRFRLRVESGTLDGAAVALPRHIDIGWYAGVYLGGSELAGLQGVPGEVWAGQRWQMRVRLKAPHGSRNPHGFDYELWLWEQGVQATGYVRAAAADPAPQMLGQTWQYPVAWARQAVRERIYSAVPQRPLAGMVAALVVGDQNAIERLDWDVFRATGVAHLVSISGLHITMFAWGAARLLGWLWRRSMRLCLWLPAPSAALVGGVLLATAYAVFSGWGVPAQRTCCMLATVALLRLSGARWPWPHVWSLACAVVLAVDPWALLQPGFWLSFIAVGVLFATDTGAASAQPASVTGRIVSMLREQWLISVALAPLTLLLFGQVSLIGLLANLGAIPWVTLVVTPLAMLGVLLPGLWAVAASTIELLRWALQWLSALPWATLVLATPPLWVGAAGTLGALVLVFPWPWRMRILGIPLLLPIAWWQPPLPDLGQFELLAADIGQGNAVLVRTAQHALLFDAGPRYSQDSDAGHRVLVPLLQALHVRLDRLVLSHRDIDHVGGAAAVLAMQPQADVLSSIEATHPLQAQRAVQRCMAGQHWDWDGVHFELLHPMPDDYQRGAKPNALSCVLRISNGTQTALLTGDIERAQEARLVASGSPLQADWLLVPHHGSKTSSSEQFLDAVHPHVALVQAGYRNRFGHPAAPVVVRYTERHIRVVDSPHCGAAVWRSEQPNVVQCERAQGLRYWHHVLP